VSHTISKTTETNGQGRLVLNRPNDSVGTASGCILTGKFVVEMEESAQSNFVLVFIARVTNLEVVVSET